MFDLLGVNGSTNSSDILMEVWSNTKLGLSPKVLLKPRELTTLRLYLLLSRWQKFVSFLLWHPSTNGIFSNLMLVMHSSMWIFWKMYKLVIPLGINGYKSTQS